MHCLLVRLSALGDLVHALPVYAALRARYPEDRVGWLVEDRHAALLTMLPGLSRIHGVPRGRWKREGFSLSEARALRRELAEADYEAALDLQGLTKSALWPALAGIPTRVGFGDADGRELARLFYNRKVKPDSTCRHVVERNLALARALDARETPGRVAFQVADEVKGSVDGWWEALGLSGRRVVVVSAGAGWESKRWPPESFGRLARLLSERLQMVPLVVWGPGEEELAEAVVAASEGVGRRAPATSIPAMLETLSRACLMVGGDTGPTHLAAYLGVPTIAPYGASDPIRNGPWGAASLVLTRDLPCRPCWKTVCPLVHRKCLNELSPEAEIDAMIGWWERLDETRQRH